MKINTLKLDIDDDRVFFFTGDWHIRQHNLAAISILLQHAQMLPIEQRVLVINGDFLDLSFLMKKHPLFDGWIKNPRGVDMYFLPEFNKEIEVANHILDMMCRVFHSVILGFGNHESMRVKKFLLQCQDKYKPEFDIRKRLHLDERKIFCYDYNTYLDIGDKAITHGSKCGAQALFNHFKVACKDVIISHLHSAGLLPFESRSDTFHAYSTPCMCMKPDHENAEYMDWGDNKWDSGYLTGAAHLGKLHMGSHIIVDNRLRLPTGQVLIAGFGLSGA